MDIDAVIERARERVDPSPDERAALERVARLVRERARAAIDGLDVDADVVQVGSTARGTWVAGDRDIDVFVRFPTTLDRQTLERYGLQVGYEVIPDGHEEYAEHPYVKGRVEGFQVDCVPCYAVEDATAIRSAVDRTPFHSEYLEARLDAHLAGEVRLAKGFLKAIGVYGSNLRTKGFSGYLTELLVLEYEGFRALLEASAAWEPQVELDPEDHGTQSFGDALVVVDPTDPERNVAAVVSTTNVSRLIHHARLFLDDPTVERFEPDEPAALDADGLRAHLARRETHPFAVVFDAPDVVEDQLYPQLERSLSGIRDGLDRQGFDVLRGVTFAEPGRADTVWDQAVILVECAVADRPAIERHIGPPIDVAAHARGFYEAYADDPTVYGPYIEDDRYVVERPRDVQTAHEYLTGATMFDVGHGAHVERALHDGYEVLSGEELTELCPVFGVELGHFFDPVP